MGTIFRRKVTGWRKAARVNCLVLLLGLVGLSICLISIRVATGEGLDKAFFFFEDDCNGGRSFLLNSALHLLINVVSTAVVS